MVHDQHFWRLTRSGANPMNITTITKPYNAKDRDVLKKMHQLRARIFGGRLKWDVSCGAEGEFDQFDELDPTYIVLLSRQGSVTGCARLLPANGRTMVNEVFPALVDKGALHAHARMIESSRFCVDTTFREGRGGRAIHKSTLTLFTGIIGWCIDNDYQEIVTVTDTRFERILNRAKWPLNRLGQPKLINETMSVAGLLKADKPTYKMLKAQLR
jgi:acyl homoserine lactone synthase